MFIHQSALAVKFFNTYSLIMINIYKRISGVHEYVKRFFKRQEVEQCTTSCSEFLLFESITGNHSSDMHLVSLKWFTYFLNNNC